MKRLLFISIMVGLMAVSCNDKDGNEPIRCVGELVFVKSYLNSYASAPWQLKFWKADYTYVYTPHNFHLNFIPTELKEYTNPELGGMPSSGKFLQLAERNGDRTYDQWIYTTEGFGACADNYKEIRMVCLNRAWDAAHPAGALLNDLMEVKFSTCGDYVRNGYQAREPYIVGETYKSYNAYRKMPMTELTPAFLEMVGYEFTFYFAELPEPGQYEVQVTMVTTEDVEQTATCTFVVE